MPSISFFQLLDVVGLSLISDHPLSAQISLLPSPLVSHSEGSSPLRGAKDKESADRSSSSKEAEK